MALTSSSDIATLIDNQFGLITRQQVLRLGMTQRVLQHRIRPGGPWRIILPGTYLTHTGEPTLSQRQMAAVLYAGTGSVITGPSALFHYGLWAADLGEVHVLVAAERRRRGVSYVQIHRTSRMPAQIATRGALPITLVPRAVVDTARSLTSRREVRDVLARAVQRGKCTVPELSAELNSGPLRQSALPRSVLAEVACGIRSAAEGDLLTVLKKSGLPMPLFNPELYLGDEFIATPDAWWPDAGVAVEVDSREWHLLPSDWERTMARHNRMAALGIMVLHFPPSKLRADPRAVIRELRDTYSQGLKRPSLRIRTISAEVPHVPQLLPCQALPSPRARRPSPVPGAHPPCPAPIPVL